MGNLSQCCREKTKISVCLIDTNIDKKTNSLNTDDPLDIILKERSNSFSESIMVPPNIELDENKYELLEHLKQHPLLSDFDEEFLIATLSTGETKTFPPRSFIFHQGEEAKSIFILISGRVEILKDSIKAQTKRPLAIIGEDCLTGKKRLSTVRTTDRSTLEEFKSEYIKKAMRHQRDRLEKDNTLFLKSLQFWNEIEELDILRNGMFEIKGETGFVFIHEGNKDEYIYFIKEGSVDCYEKRKLKKKLFSGQFFGEELLVLNLSKYTVVANTRTIVLGVCLKDLQQIRIPFEFFEMQIFEALQNSYSFLNKDQIESFFCEVKQGESSLNTFKGIIVILKGCLESENNVYNSITCIDNIKLGEQMSPGEYTVKPGSLIFSISKESLKHSLVDLKKLKWIHTLRKLPYFNMLQNFHLKQLALISETRTYVNQTIFYEEDPAETVYGIIKGVVSVYKEGKYKKKSRKAIGSIFQYPREKFTCVSEGETTLVCLELAKIPVELVGFINSQYFRDSSLKIHDMIPIRILGEGGGGTVVLAVHRHSSKLFAVKTTTNHPTFKSERKLLRKLQHPMIMKLIKPLKTKKKIFLITEFIKGVSFYTCIRNLQPLSLTNAKFYTACLALIVEYLHNKSIVYRDLKPENIMIDEEGYPKIVDFGTAKIVKGRTYTAVGTSLYLAPEVVSGEGHSFEVDWWSLGVIVYELMVGHMPFGDSATDIEEIYEEILYKDVSFPDRFDWNTKSFILFLLNRDPKGRNGCLMEKWLEEIKWDELFLKSVKAPFVPKVINMDGEVNAARAANYDFLKFLKGKIVK